MEISVHPENVSIQQSQALRTGQFVTDCLSIFPVKVDGENGVLPGVDPVNVVSLHVDGEVQGVGDVSGHQGRPVGSVQVGSGDHRELTVVQPVEIFLDRIDGNLPRVVRG